MVKTAYIFNYDLLSHFAFISCPIVERPASIPYSVQLTAHAQKDPPLPLHPKTPMHALILHTREGKIQQLPMQSHPASCVPRVLLIPRSCRCLSPFPLTRSSYLSCKGRRGSEGEKTVEEDFQKQLCHRHLAVK